MNQTYKICMKFTCSNSEQILNIISKWLMFKSFTYRHGNSDTEHIITLELQHPEYVEHMENRMIERLEFYRLDYDAYYKG